MKKLCTIIILFSLFSVWVLAADYSNSTTDKEWLQYGRTFDNSRYYPSAINLTNFGMLWNKTANDFSGDYYSTPVAKDGVVYLPAIYGFVFQNSVMFAINSTNGDQIWNVSLPNIEIQHSAIAGNVLYSVGARPYDNVFAFNRSNGNILWNATAIYLGSNFPTAPLVYDDMLFVLGYHSSSNSHPMLYVFNITNGAQIINRSVFSNLNYRGAESMAIYDDSYLIVGAGHGTCPGGVGKVFAYNVSNISQQFWTQDVGCGQIMGLAVSDDVVFVPTSGNNTLWSLNATNGNHVWNYTANAAVHTSPAILKTPAVDYVYIGSSDTVLHAINISSGGLIWNASNAIDSDIAAVVSDNVLFTVVGTTVKAYNSVTGVSLWNGSVNIRTYSDPIFVDDPLFVVTSSSGPTPGYLYSFGQIPGCGNVNQSITLTRDLVSNSTCLNVVANNTVIDCAGHSITGNLSGPFTYEGIMVNNVNNVTVRNCIIHNFTYGIQLSNSHNSTLDNNTLYNNSYGVALVSTSNQANILNNFIRNNSKFGLFLQTSSNGSIINNILKGNNIGLHLNASSSDNNITNNNFSNNVLHGIDIPDGTSTGNIFRSCSVGGSGSFDLHLDSPSTTNSFFDITLTDSSTSVSFSDFNGSVHLSGIANPPATPTGLRSAGNFFNMTKTAGEWIVLNVSYTNADINNIRENTLRYYRFVNTSWQLVNSTVIAAQNKVTANISNFSGFGVFGSAQQASSGGGGGGSNSYTEYVGYCPSYCSNSKYSGIGICQSSVCTGTSNTEKKIVVEETDSGSSTIPSESSVQDKGVIKTNTESKQEYKRLPSQDFTPVIEKKSVPLGFSIFMTVLVILLILGAFVVYKPEYVRKFLERFKKE